MGVLNDMLTTSKNHWKQALFLILMIAFGGYLATTVMQIQKDLPDCTDNKVERSLNLIMMIGVLIAVMALMRIMCGIGCDSCTVINKGFMSVFIILFLVLGVISAIAWSGMKDDCSNDEKKTNTSIGGITIVSFSLFAILSAYKGYEIYKE